MAADDNDQDLIRMIEDNMQSTRVEVTPGRAAGAAFVVFGVAAVASFAFGPLGLIAGGTLASGVAATALKGGQTLWMLYQRLSPGAQLQLMQLMVMAWKARSKPREFLTNNKAELAQAILFVAIPFFMRQLNVGIKKKN